MKTAKILVAALLLVAAAVLAFRPRDGDEPEPPDQPRLAAGLALRDVTFFSAALGRAMPYRVILPAAIVPGQRLSAVYLLHGGGADFRSWSNDSDVARYALPGAGSPGLILVMPEGDASFYMNAAERPDDRYQDYLTRDLIADVQARFPAAPDRAHRAVVGISFGGFAVLKLALDHPDLFCFGGAVSPSVDILVRHYGLMFNGMWPWIRGIFGAWGSPQRRVSDPFVLVNTAIPSRTPYLYITVGEQEPLLDSNRRFAGLLGQRGFAAELHTSPGNHDWEQWNTQLPGLFQSLFRHLPPAR